MGANSALVEQLRRDYPELGESGLGREFVAKLAEEGLTAAAGRVPGAKARMAEPKGLAKVAAFLKRGKRKDLFEGLDDARVLSTLALAGRVKKADLSYALAQLSLRRKAEAQAAGADPTPGEPTYSKGLARSEENGEGLPAGETQAANPGAFMPRWEDENQRRSYEEAVDKIAAGENLGGSMLELGRPGEALRRAGVRDLPVRMAQKVVSLKGKAGRRKDHFIGWENVKRIPYAMNNPWAVFQDEKSKDFRVLTEIEAEGKPVLVALKVGSHEEGTEINVVPTVFGKRSGSLAAWMKGEVAGVRLLYLDEARTPEGLLEKQEAPQPKRAPIAQGSQGFSEKISFSTPQDVPEVPESQASGRLAESAKAPRSEAAMKKPYLREGGASGRVGGDAVSEERSDGGLGHLLRYFRFADHGRIGRALREGGDRISSVRPERVEAPFGKEVVLLGEKVEAPEDLARLTVAFRHPYQEFVGVGVVGEDGRIGAVRIIAAGSLNATTLPYQPILREARKVRGGRVFLWHNHPGGDPKPSRADVEVTKRVSRLLGRSADKVFGGHLVLNGKEFSLLRPAGDTLEIQRLPVPVPELAVWEKVSRDELGGMDVFDMPRVAAALRQSEPGDFMHGVFLNNQMRVVGVRRVNAKAAGALDLLAEDALDQGARSLLISRNEPAGDNHATVRLFEGYKRFFLGQGLELLDYSDPDLPSFEASGLIDVVSEVPLFSKDSGGGPKRRRRDEPGRLLAPNGKPSNLSEENWEAARTPAFKERFGDWERLALQRLLDGAPVAKLRGDEFKTGGTTLVNDVVKFYEENHDAAVSHPLLGKVNLRRRGVKDSLGEGIGPEKAAAFAAVPEVLEQGHLLDRRENWKGRGYDTAVIGAPFEMAGTTYVMTVVVREEPKSKHFQVHEVQVREKLRAGGLQTRLEAALAGGNEATSAGPPGGALLFTLLQGIYAVKPESVKVALDANGEPVKAAVEAFGSGEEVRFSKTRQAELDLGVDFDRLAERVASDVTAPQSRVAGLWLEAARKDDAFRFRSSSETDLRAVVDEVGNGSVVVRGHKDGGGYEKFDLRLTHAPDQGGIRVQRSLGEVTVDSQYAGQGSGLGAPAYQSIYTWAHNNGYVVEHGGITEVNQLRLTAHQLSSALRFKTTKHFNPTPEQGVRGWGGTYANRVARLALREAELAFDRVPELRNFGYDFNQGHYYEVGHSGDRVPVDEVRIDRVLAGSDPHHASGVGATTAQRSILTTAVAEDPRHGGGLAEGALEHVREGSLLRGLLYSKQGEADPATGRGKFAVRVLEDERVPESVKDRVKVEYEVQANEETLNAALELFHGEHPEAKWRDTSNDLDPATRGMLGQILLLRAAANVRLAEALGDGKLADERAERAAALANKVAEQAREWGRGVQVFSAFSLLDAHSLRRLAKRQVAKAQKKRMEGTRANLRGRREAADVADQVADALEDSSGKAAAEATGTPEAAAAVAKQARKRKPTSPSAIWGRYKADASRRIVRLFGAGFEGSAPKAKPALQEFTERLIRHGREKVREELGGDVFLPVFGEEERAGYEADLDVLAAGGSLEGRQLELGRPGGVLRELGMEDLPVRMNERVAKGKILNPNDAGHAIDLQDLKRLPDAMNDPLAVFRHQDGDWRILTEIEVDGKPVLAVVKVTGAGRAEVNLVRTAFAKRAAALEKWLAGEDPAVSLLYLDEVRLRKRKSLPVHRAPIALGGKAQSQSSSYSTPESFTSGRRSQALRRNYSDRALRHPSSREKRTSRMWRSLPVERARSA